MKYYVQVMNQDLRQRQLHNPQYSMRAYARDLGLDSSSLSQVMRGQRPLPLKTAGEVVRGLGLNPVERTKFLESLHRSRLSIDSIEIPEEDDRFMLDESYYKVIAEWEHYAVLTLYDLEGFSARIEEIARRLNLTSERAEEVVGNLLACGLLELSDSGDLVKAHPVIRTTEDSKNRALVDSHLETLEMAKAKLRTEDVDRRDYSSSTLAIDPEMLPAAKTIIREFRMKMSALLKTGKRREVYQLAVQFFPLTESQEEST
jgi:uncharacterized protein (TIGR02147 family)